MSGAKQIGLNVARTIFVLAMVLIVLAPDVYAAQSNSTNYGVSEVNFGSGGETRACSATICSKQAAGELTVGNTVGSRVPATGVNLTNAPTADAYVLSSTPTVNNGTTNPLRASSTTTRALLKFDTSGIPLRSTIKSVTLQLYSTNSQGGSYQIHPEGDGWTEAGVNWNNQPTWDPSIIGTTEIATTNVNVSASLPVGSVLVGGTTNFGINYSATGVTATFASREDATHPPQLIVVYDEPGPVQAQAGFNTDRQPLLEMSVGSGAVTLGDMTPSITRSGTSTFSVRTYLASGYNVIVAGSAPTNKAKSKTLTNLVSPTTSTVGTEQFGINLVANTSPVVGANPVQYPDATFGFGTAASGYGTANSFKYVNGDVIAQSSKSSGRTDYTMSIIQNISASTPGGSYAGHLDVIAVPTF